jgi:hypothetical protein
MGYPADWCELSDHTIKKLAEQTMPKRKPDAVKNCLSCGKPLKRKKYGNALEKAGQFRERKYCDPQCKGASNVLEEPTLAAVRTRNRKVVAMARAEKCRDCGATEDLCLHHEDENPENNSPENLTTLCRACHLREHQRRKRMQSA